MPWLPSCMVSFLPGPAVWATNPGRKLTPYDLESRLASPLILNWVLNSFSPVNQRTGCSFCPSLAAWGEWLPALLAAFGGARLGTARGDGWTWADPQGWKFPTRQNLKTWECKSSNNPQLLRSPLLPFCLRREMHGWQEQLCSPTGICCWDVSLGSHPCSSCALPANLHLLLVTSIGCWLSLL